MTFRTQKIPLNIQPPQFNSFNLRKLTNQELDLKLKALIHQERELLSEILHHIHEVDRRRLYLDLAYPNLFAYLTEHLGYSQGSAQRRLEAARLLKDIPELAEKLESGKLKLSQIALVQKCLRQKKKQTGSTLSAPEKAVLLSKLEGQSQGQSEVLVAKALDLEIQAAPRLTHQADQSVRLELTFTREEWTQLQRMRELLSNSLPNGSDWKDTFNYLAQRVIAQKTNIQRPPRPSQNPEVVTTSVRKHVLHRDQSCQHTHQESGRRCGSKWKLQIDHHRPLWDQGPSTPENLRILCASHNQDRYRKQAGLRRA